MDPTFAVFAIVFSVLFVFYGGRGVASHEEGGQSLRLINAVFFSANGGRGNLDYLVKLHFTVLDSCTL